MTNRALPHGLRALAVAGVLLACSRAQSGFQDVLPPETLVFVGVDDTTRYVESFRASPLGQLWFDPACAELRQVTSEHLAALGDEAEMALGVDVMRLPALLDGPLAIALLDLRLEPGNKDPGIALCVLADVGPNVDECRQILDQLSTRLLAEQQGIARSTESIERTEVVSFHDAQVDVHSGSRLRYAMQGSVAVVLLETGGLGRDDLPGILDALDSPRPRSLASLPAFRESLAGAGTDNVRAWADLGQLMQRVHVSSTDDADADKNERQIKSLGLRDLGVCSMRLQCTAQGSYAAVQLDWPGNGWIPRMLRNFFKPAEFTRLRHVPAGVRGVDALHLDLPGLFDEVVKLVIAEGASPAEVVAGLSEAEEFLGFNPRDELLDLFDGEFVLVSADVEREEALPTLGDSVNVGLIAGLRDGQAFTDFLDDVIQRRGLRVTDKPEEYEGVTIHCQKVFMVPWPICYVVVDDMLVLSCAPSLVRQIVHKRNAPDAPGFAELPAYRQAVAQLRPGYGLLGYSDAAADMKSILHFLVSAPETFGEEDDTGVLDWIAQLPLPDESVVDKYFHGGTVTAVTVDEKGVFLESAGP